MFSLTSMGYLRKRQPKTVVLQALEDQLKNSGIKLDYRLLKTNAFITVVPEYVVICFCIVTYAKNLNFNTVLDFFAYTVHGN